MNNFTRNCKWCLVTFQTSNQTKSYCDRRCKETAKKSRKQMKNTTGIEVPSGSVRHWVKTLYIKWCKNCNETISTQKGWQLYCDKTCSDMMKQTIKRQMGVKKFQKNNAPNIVARIYYRDKGLCGICKDPIDLRLQYPNPYSISVDHVLPVSQGGTNLQSNLQPAHLICNTKRGNKPLDS